MFSSFETVWNLSKADFLTRIERRENKGRKRCRKRKERKKEKTEERERKQWLKNKYIAKAWMERQKTRKNSATD